MPYLNETDYQELTEARYQDEQTIADLEAELKTKKRDTEHLLELGKQITAIAYERDRLREVKKLAREVNSLLDSTMSWMDEEGIQVPFIMSVMIGSLGEKSRELAAALKAKG